MIGGSGSGVQGRTVPATSEAKHPAPECQHTPAPVFPGRAMHMGDVGDQTPKRHRAGDHDEESNDPRPRDMQVGAVQKRQTPGEHLGKEQRAERTQRAVLERRES